MNNTSNSFNNIINNYKNNYNNYFYNDKNNYILCKWEINNISKMNIMTFLTINDAYIYIINSFNNIINQEDFYNNYNYYKNIYQIANGDYLLCSNDYVFEFQYENYYYELYRIDNDSKYVLLTFNIDLNLISSVKGYINNTDIINKIKKLYINTFNKEISNSDKCIIHNNIELIKRDDIIFAMIFKIYNNI